MKTETSEKAPPGNKQMSSPLLERLSIGTPKKLQRQITISIVVDEPMSEEERQDGHENAA